ncbi:hypothetical protein EIP86_003959 [Pleurotus ostreatoroseus]|nr:hypothetical protein EIP86_003959 [Pleurotus ostreatoroseus]
MPTTVILGTGIIGLSTAYYLSHLADPDSDQQLSSQKTTPTASDTHPSSPKHEIHLVEPCPELFSSASGKAAGFLAKDWFAPAVAPLGAFSFDLHRELAQAHDGATRWGWCESVSYSLDRDESDVDEDEVWDDDAKAEKILDSASEAEGIPREKLDGVSGHGQTNGYSNGTHDGRAAGAAKEDGEPKSRTQSTDLQWLMDGSSRATLLEGPYAEADSTANGDAGADTADEHPRWLRAKKSALQAISDRSTTGQVPFICS